VPTNFRTPIPCFGAAKGAEKNPNGMESKAILEFNCRLCASLDFMRTILPIRMAWPVALKM